MDNNTKPSSKFFEDSTYLIGQPEELREKADQEGYLFFKGLLNKRNLLNVRKCILEIFQSRGLLDSQHDLMDGIADVEAVNQQPADIFRGGSSRELYNDIQKLEAFHRLAHEPNLLNMFEQLFGETVLPHPRNIARVIAPHRELATTPSHQDFIHIQGTTQAWTAWFPLGDCPRDLGGLTILEGSHRSGLLNVTKAQGAGGLETILCDLDYEWVEGDYEAGDVVVFHSYTVHKALPSKQPKQIRLSCDFRYQPVSEPIEHKSLLPHGSKDGDWEAIYHNWDNDDLKYYWKKYDLSLSDWDEKVNWQKEKIC